MAPLDVNKNGEEPFGRILDTTVSNCPEYLALFPQDTGQVVVLEDLIENLEDDAVLPEISEISVSPSAQAKLQKVSSTKQSPRKKHCVFKPGRYAPATRSTKSLVIEHSYRMFAVDELGNLLCSFGDAPSEEVQPPKRFEIPEDLKAGCKTERAFRDLASYYDRLNALDRYKAEYGDCDVPQSYPKLGSWVNKMREQYKKYINGQRSSLNERKISELNEIGFVWGKQKGDVLWDTRYQELVHFFQKNGHSNVPTRRADRSTSVLGRWVSTQREQYRRYDPKKPSSSLMTQARIDRLNKVKFSWKMNCRSSDRPCRSSVSGKTPSGRRN